MSDIVTRARELLAGITPPWRAVTTGVRNGDHWYVCESDEAIASIAANDGFDEHMRQPRAEFIAAAPQLVADLAAEVEELRAILFLIQEARVDYDGALVRREHGAVAADRFMRTTFAALDALERDQ